MIIQCRQCRTKFRFDDSHMQGSGIWLRCSRCGHVYFQENPFAKRTDSGALPLTEPDLETKPVNEEEKTAPSETASVPPEEAPSIIRRDEHVLKSIDKIMTARKRDREGIDLDIATFRDEKVGEADGQTGDIVQEEQEVNVEETDHQKKTLPKGSGRIWKTALWSVLVIGVIPLLIYFFILPQYGAQLVGSGEYLFKKISELRGAPELPTSGAYINQMVKLQNVRYRRINNYILGQIGVLEGTALNRADFPLSRVQVKGEIVDAYSVVLGERSSYAGNILTDEELINLSEEEILMKLLRPEGLNNANDRIMPNGQIPFMIVFPSEPSGVIKTTVMTIGAERLLEP